MPVIMGEVTIRAYVNICKMSLILGGEMMMEEGEGCVKLQGWVQLMRF